MAELVDAHDSKSCSFTECRFDSGLGYQALSSLNLGLFVFVPDTVFFPQLSYLWWMETLFKIALVTGLLLMACSCSFSEHSSENFTDTIQTRFRLFNSDRDIKPNRDTVICMLIRQKTDSSIKYSYYWTYDHGDLTNYNPTQVESYTFNIRNDSFQLVEWYTYWDKAHLRKSELFPPGLIFANKYEDKQNDSIRFYKYEKVNTGLDGEGTLLFSKEYGLMARLSYQWGGGNMITHWQNQLINPAYPKLFAKNRHKLYSEEVTAEIGRVVAEKDTNRIVW